MIYNVIGYSDRGLWVLSVVVGIIFICHGFPKIRNPKGIASAYRAPAVFGLFHGLVEVLGGAGLILGMSVHFIALIFGIIMVLAIGFKTTRWNVPFMAHDKTGWEFDLLVLASCLILYLS